MLGSDINYFWHIEPLEFVTKLGFSIAFGGLQLEDLLSSSPGTKSRISRKTVLLPLGFEQAPNLDKNLFRICQRSSSQCEEKKRIKGIACWAQTSFFWHIEPLESALLPDSGSLLPSANYNLLEDRLPSLSSSPRTKSKIQKKTIHLPRCVFEPAQSFRKNLFEICQQSFSEYTE